MTTTIAVHGADPRVADALHRYATTATGQADLAGSRIVVAIKRRRTKATGTFYVEVEVADCHRTGDTAADAAALVWYLLFKAIQTVHPPWANTKGYRCAAAARRTRRVVQL